MSNKRGESLNARVPIQNSPKMAREWKEGTDEKQRLHPSPRRHQRQKQRRQGVGYHSTSNSPTPLRRDGRASRVGRSVDELGGEVIDIRGSE